MKKQLILPVCLALSGFSLSGCAALIATDAAVGTAVSAGKTAVRGTVGAGKLVARGVGATTRGLTSGQSDPAGYDCIDQPDGQKVCYQRK